MSATLATMEQEESRLLQLRRDATEHSNRESHALILIGCLSALLLLGASGAGLYFDISARRRAEESRSKALADLRQSNEELAKEAARTAEAQLCLQESERSLRDLSRHLLRSQDDERRRIGRDMHDSVGQYLSMLMMKLD
ncbi:MAG TPA: histidine kinase, partial [Candidatus Acidoferrales bacterium]|nr:histidine kinase [Candidatus Acidoferrales bacterium]